MSDYKQLVRDHVLDRETFIRATFSGRRRGHDVPWQKVVVRPVSIKDKRHIQFSHFDEVRDVTKNYAGAQIVEKLDELLALPFGNIHLRTTVGDIQIQVTRKGKAVVHRRRAPERRETPSLEHDHQKSLLLPAGKPDPFLQAIGIVTQEGKVRASMRRKYQQINRFLKLVIEAGGWDEANRSPLNVVDCGCGGGYLTFAVYHYLSHVLGVPTRMIGIDVDEDLLQERFEQCRALGWSDLTFQATRIVDFQPAHPPDVVLALHACDTATDEALAQAVRWQSEMIFSVPCCHHHLQQQMDRQTAPPEYAPVLRHGILKERLGDILTDSFRAQILRVMGYRTDVVEFISAEHTAKNLMIRAVKSTGPGDQQAIREYEALVGSWQVRPYLEQLLERELSPLFQAIGVRPSTAPEAVTTV